MDGQIYEVCRDQEGKIAELETEVRRMKKTLILIRNTAEHHSDSAHACNAIEGTHCKRDRAVFCELCQRAHPP